MDNVIITPHMSGDTEDHDDDLAALFVNNPRRYRREIRCETA